MKRNTRDLSICLALLALSSLLVSSRPAPPIRPARLPLTVHGVALGMTGAQVKSLWGEPESVGNGMPGTTCWHYALKPGETEERFIWFADRTGKVDSIRGDEVSAQDVPVTLRAGVTVAYDDLVQMFGEPRYRGHQQIRMFFERSGLYVGGELVQAGVWDFLCRTPPGLVSRRGSTFRLGGPILAREVDINWDGCLRHL